MLKFGDVGNSRALYERFKKDFSMDLLNNLNGEDRCRAICAKDFLGFKNLKK